MLFFSKVKHRCLCQSDFSIGQLIDRADSKLLKQVQFSRHCLNPLCNFPALILVTLDIPQIQRTSVLVATNKYSVVHKCIY